MNKKFERIGTLELKQDVVFRIEQESASIPAEHVYGKAGEILQVVGIRQQHRDGGVFVYRSGLVLKDGRVFQCYSFGLQEYGQLRLDEGAYRIENGTIYGER